MITPQTWLEEVANSVEGHLSTMQQLWLPRAVSQPHHILRQNAEATRRGGSTRGLDPPRRGATSGAKAGPASKLRAMWTAGAESAAISSRKSVPEKYLHAMISLHWRWRKKCPLKQTSHEEAQAWPSIQLPGGLAASSAQYDSVPTYFL